MIIDATNLIVGRMATVVAKKALLGEKIDIVNCENAIITGSKTELFNSLKQKIDRGIPSKGPHIHRMPDRYVRRIIRGMLPYKQAKGREAFNRVMCHIAVPEQFKDKKLETVEQASMKKLTNLKYARLGDLLKTVGAKI